MFQSSEVGRILDTIFNNNHDSTPTLLSTNGGGVSSRDVSDDFVMPETSSHSSQAAVHSIVLPTILSSTSFATHSPRTTEITTSTANNSEQRNHRSISPQKDTVVSIQNGVSGTEVRTPETCTNDAEGAASNAMCSSNGSTSTSDNGGSSSSSSGSNGDSGSTTQPSTINSTTAPVSISPFLPNQIRAIRSISFANDC